MLRQFKIYQLKINKYTFLLKEFDNERFMEFIERKRMKREEVF